MLATLEPTQGAEQLKPEPTPVDVVIVREVLARLGRPADLHRVQVKPVSNSKYRVNVYVRDAASYRVAHSYFLETDGAGKILVSSPAITRAY